MVERSQVPVFKQDPILVLVLGFITCGLYYIYWNIKMAEVINAVAERELVAPVVAVLAGCCMPVQIYFYYLVGQMLGNLGALTGNDQLSEKSTLFIILGILFPPAAAMILQGHVNEIYGA